MTVVWRGVERQGRARSADRQSQKRGRGENGAWWDAREEQRPREEGVADGAMLASMEMLATYGDLLASKDK